MKMIADPTGRFRERPFYEPDELDRDCEKTLSAFLRDIHGKVAFPVVTDDLTKLIERHVEDLDPYADLSGYGQGVEGVTEFRPHHKPTVRIAAALSNETFRENRLRTTLTHELGHVLYHTWLFDQRHGGSLFPLPARTDDVQVCKRDTMLDAPQTDWMEWQAGHVCGAFLMPISRIRKLIEDTARTTPPPALEPITAETAFGRALIDSVIDRFAVSREAAEVRLRRLNALTSPARRPTPRFL
jgi:hypothetical protein